jgi:hypothetical protein
MGSDVKSDEYYKYPVQLCVTDLGFPPVMPPPNNIPHVGNVGSITLFPWRKVASKFRGLSPTTTSNIL